MQGVAAQQPAARASRRTGSWRVELPIDSDGELRVHAIGVGDSARQVINYLAHRAQRRCGVLQARVASIHDVIAGGERHNQLLRQATLGALSSSLLHDLASTIQSLSVALTDISELADPRTPGLQAAVADASSAGDQAVQLFIQMRKFIRDGEVSRRSVAADVLAERALRLVGGYVRERAVLNCDFRAAVGAEVEVAEALFLQVLANLLRNAANASPPGGAIDMIVAVDADEIAFTITDDGPGVAAEICDSLFEPFASATHGGTGLGLAISAYVVQLLHGRIAYQRTPTRGACFSVTVPRSRPAE